MTIEYKEATLKELGLENVPFPEGFTPRWYAGDYTKIDGALFYWVYENKPNFSYQFGGMWVQRGDWYELGEKLADTAPKHSLVKIIEETKNED